MAEEKTKKTLFHVVRPLLTLLNLAYGLNLGNRKPLGSLRELRRKLHKFSVWLFFLLNLYLYFRQRMKDIHASLFDYRYYTVIFLLSSSFYVLAFNEPEMKKLLRRLKRYEMGNISERVTSRMIMLFLLALAPVALQVTKHASHMIKSVCGLTSLEGNSSLLSVYYFFACSIAFAHLSAALLFLLSVFIFPLLLSCLCCVLVSYCPSRLDDHVEDILRAHSPLRRATLLSKLCYEYYQLQPLASMTNRNMATTMSFMKIFTMLLWVLCCHLLEDRNIWLLLNLPILQYTLPLLMYLLVAPSANHMQIKLLEAATEVLMVDDEWQGHDLISRSLLAKMRLNLLQHLVPIRMDRGPFTLLGDSVDPETLFMIFIEANDLRTTLR